MTDIRLKDFAEGYCIKNMPMPITIVTKYAAALACVYFNRKLYDDLCKNGIIVKGRYGYTYNGHIADILEVIADKFTEKSGVKTINRKLQDSSYRFTFDNQCVLNGYFRQCDMEVEEVLIHRNLHNTEVNDAIDEDLKKTMDDMFVCETLDDVLLALECAYNNSGKFLNRKEINRRVDFISGLCKYIIDVFYDIERKDDPRYNLYYDAWSFIKDNLGVERPGDCFHYQYHDDFITDEMKFKQVVEVAYAVKYNEPIAHIYY